MVSRHFILITSKVNVFEDTWLSFQVRKTINIMALELYRKKKKKNMCCQHPKPPNTLINILFILPLPSPFSNEYTSGNKLTYLLPKFTKGYCAVIY